VKGKAVATAVSLLLGAGALAACGERRTAAPDVSRPAAPTGSVARGFPSLGLDFRSAANWSYEIGRPPLVAMMSSGQGVVAIWRYPRAQPLPSRLAQLRSARRALLLAARARDPTFAARQDRILHLAGQPAIELLGVETVGGQRQALRSVHVYAHADEFVVDALAPERYFAAVDASLFVPLLGTLRFPTPVVATAAATPAPAAVPGAPAAGPAR
jgi:hypothetical protein